MSRDALACLALGCLTLLLYAPVRNHEFLNFDDPGYVNEAHVQRGLSAENARWALTTLQFSNWHPLTWLSHMTDVALFGNNAGAHHIVNAALQAINAVLLYLVLRTLTARPWESLAVAAIWSSHPLRVESVAWVAERKDLLCGMFFLLSIACYARYARRGSTGAYLGSLACFILGLASKSMIVTLPFVLLLLDAWILRRRQSWSRLVVEKLPFFALTAAVGVVTYIAQRQGGAMGVGDRIPALLRVGNAFVALASYLQFTVWPTDLAIFYPYNGALGGTSLSAGRLVAGIVLLLAGSAIAVFAWRRERAVLVGWLWFLGALVPVIGLVQVGRQSMADRYTYVPHIGLLIMVVWGISAAARRLGNRWTTAAAFSAALAVIAFSVRSVDQLQHWRNSETLFAHALDVTQHNHVAHSSLALALAARGDDAGAIEHYRRNIEITPNEPQPYYNIGQIYLVAGDFVRAQEWLQKAIQLDANYADAQGNLAKAFANQGRHADAIRHFREVVRLRPSSYLAHYDLAVELADSGENDEALAHFAEAIRLDPDRPEPRYAHALALTQSGRLDEAKAAYERYLELAGRRGVSPLPIPTTNPDNRPRTDVGQPR